MKNHSLRFPVSHSILSACILGVVASTASAAITVDLRAGSSTVGTIVNGGKQVNVAEGGTGTITLEIWAQITNASPTGPTFGVNQILGSVVSNTVSQGGVTGSLSTATRLSPYNDPSSNAGTAGEYSASHGLPADTIGDVGAAQGATSATTQVIFSKTGSDSSRGTNITGTYVISNTDPAGATFQSITNGYEFKMGTVTLSISNFGATTQFTENWYFPTAFNTATKRNALAIWTQGDGVLHQGNEGGLLVGAPVLIMVPEPSAFGMIALGAFSLVGFRRFGFRRTA